MRTVLFSGAAVAARSALVLTALLIFGLGRPSMTLAQAPTDRSAFRLEVTWAAAALSYTRHASDAWFYGVGGGLGAGMMHAVVSPVRLTGPDVRHGEAAHIEGFVSWTPSSTFHIDLGARTAVVLYSRDAVNGAGFVGPYIAPAIGSRRLKIGSRVQVGYLYTPHGSGMAIYVQPVVLRIAFPR